MSSTSHLTGTLTSETKNDKAHSRTDLRTLPCDGLSNLIHLSSTPTTNSKYLYYVNAEPTRKQQQQQQPVVTTSTNARRKLSSISLSVPWYRRTRSPSDDKPTQKHPKMSRDRLLPLDKLFSSATHSTPLNNDDDQASPTNDLSPLDDSNKLHDKKVQQIKENGYLRNPSHLVTR